jgi:hypothetical protein
MPEPQATIQSSRADAEAVRTFFNRTPYQTLRYFGITNNATVTELFIDGVPGNRLKVPTDSVVTIHAIGAGYQVTGTPAGSSNRILGGALNNGGTVTLIANQSVLLSPTAGNVSTPSLTIDNATGVKSLNLNVVGITGQTVRHEYLVTVASASNPESYNPDVAVPIA